MKKTLLMMSLIALLIPAVATARPDDDPRKQQKAEERAERDKQRAKDDQRGPGSNRGPGSGDDSDRSTSPNAEPNRSSQKRKRHRAQRRRGKFFAMYVLRGTLKSIDSDTAVVEVTAGNRRTRRLRGEEVTVNISKVKFAGIDRNDDGENTLEDFDSGDSVAVKARGPRFFRVATLPTFIGRVLVQRTPVSVDPPSDPVEPPSDPVEPPSDPVEPTTGG